MAGRAIAIKREPEKNPSTSKPEPTETVSPVLIDVEERIRIRAHQIYLERAGKDGSELDDWLRAEAEIKGGQA